MNNMSMWRAIVVASQVGFVLAAAVVIGLLLGSYLDSLTKLSPLFTILGVIAGVASGLFSCVQLVRYAFRGRSE